jgi:AcrR family transcriptional regulator
MRLAHHASRWRDGISSGARKNKIMGSRKDLILVAAVRLMKKHGWDKTTVAEIAREANVGTGTVYLEFRSKESIILELSMQRYGETLRAMRRATMRKGSWSDRLRAMVNERTIMFMNMRQEGEHAADLLYCPRGSVQRARDTFERGQIELLVDFLTAAMEEDATRDKNLDPRRTANALMLAYTSFTPPELFKIEQEEILERLESLHEIILSGVFNET